MVISFRVVSESVSSCNVLRRQELWRERSVRRFCTSTWALLAVGRRHHCIDMVLSDSMGFSFWCLAGTSYDRGTGMSKCVCVGCGGCFSRRATVGELWSIGCNQPPPTALTHWLVSQWTYESINQPHVSIQHYATVRIARIPKAHQWWSAALISFSLFKL